MTADSIALAFGAIAVVLILYHWHRTDDQFDLRHLLTDSKTGRVSLMKAGQALALVVSTWIIINETRHARLSEWLFMGYMLAWSGANLAKRWIDRGLPETK